MLVLADMHMDGDLKEAAQEFTLKHEEMVFDSEEWSKFSNGHSCLAAKTMLMIWKKRRLSIEAKAMFSTPGKKIKCIYVTERTCKK
ncbi:hypothetical protein NPIL_439501 [Nephila pilipes]|uniref:Uncharacterized protein n=1 Tax=Nephila pilipes TaxID=299642 RepID=A0A8X6MXW7_NEPPI|nr:hypothetical protein NPIL_439501 [Nephila pilipes]